MTVETLQFGGTADDIPAVGELNMWHDENEKVRCMPFDLSARTVPVAANSKNRRTGGLEETAEGKSCGFTASPPAGEAVPRGWVHRCQEGERRRQEGERLRQVA